MLPRFCRLPGRWHFYLLLVALLAARPAAAQETTAPPGAAPAGLPPAPADTSAAVRRLFAEHRTGNRARLVSAGFLVIFGNYGLAYAGHETTFEKVSIGLTIAALTYEVFILGQTLTWQHRYSRAREQAVLAALAQGRPLPHRVRRRLKPRYFGSPPAAN